jgi:hypothetical protein
MTKKIFNSQGQALIELIIFLPLMFILYSVITGFANAINGSINQQKVTRGYFYFRVQNNSTIPKPQAIPTGKFTQFGSYIVGWKDYFQGEQPVMPCYKVTIPMKGSSEDTCEKSYAEEKSQYIRVGTVYGVCGATYARSGQGVYQIPDEINQNFTSTVDPSSCSLR